MDCKLYAVRVFVTDWDRAIRFYTETLGIRTVIRDDTMGWAELDTGETHLALERAQPDDREASSLVGRFVAASLAVNDIEATCQHLTEQGVEFVTPPEKQDWGGVLANFKDPDGNVITLLGMPS